ncbi:unnamed protein product [Ilex paraguariensis]|uniref:Uncharacterized protein n=1 Tax=Ilex paraguariensis TaxID=185542 RepID=A0ABC8SP95_9AQUA
MEMRKYKFLASCLNHYCCDGSDEYDGMINCPNTCWEAGKVARDKLQKKIATYQEGVTVRRLKVEEAKLAIAKDEAELTKFKNEEKILKGLVQQLRGIFLFFPVNSIIVVMLPLHDFVQYVS